MTDQSSTQAVERFYELLLKATSVRVIAGSSISTKRNNDKLLFLATDVVALSELRDALRVRPLGAQLHIMTPGDPTLVFMAGKDTLLTVQYLGGDPDLVRSDVLGEDAFLMGRDALTAWLSKYGNNHGDLGYPSTPAMRRTDARPIQDAYCVTRRVESRPIKRG